VGEPAAENGRSSYFYFMPVGSPWLLQPGFSSGYGGHNQRVRLAPVTAESRSNLRSGIDHLAIHIDIIALLGYQSERIGN
jgi:hypothetical protein